MFSKSKTSCIGNKWLIMVSVLSAVKSTGLILNQTPLLPPSVVSFLATYTGRCPVSVKLVSDCQASPPLS